MANVNLNVIFGAVDKGLRGMLGTTEKGIAGLSGKLTAAGAAFTAVGGAITGTLGLMVRDAANYGEEINRAAGMTGMATEALSKLRFAGEQSEVEFGTLTMALGRMMRSAYDASQGTGEAADSWRALGIDVRDAGGNLKDGQALFGEIAARIAGISNPTEKAALAMRVFGRGGAQLLPLLNEGAAGIEEFGKRAEELGIVLDTKAAAAGDAFNDTMAETKLAVRGMAVSLGTVLLPILTDVAKAVADGTAWFRQFSEAHPTLAQGAIYVAGGLGLLMATLGPLMILVAQTLPLWGALAGAGGVAGVGASLLALAGPAGAVALVVAALVGLGIILDRTIGMFREASAAADQAFASGQAAVEMQAKMAAAAGPEQWAEHQRQMQERNAISAQGSYFSWARLKQAFSGFTAAGREKLPTADEMLSGYITPNRTGWDIARERYFANQPGATVNVYIGPEKLDDRIVRVTRGNDRAAAQGAW
jgi:TP901 family phage tail tape measure protein